MKDYTMMKNILFSTLSAFYLKHRGMICNWYYISYKTALQFMHPTLGSMRVKYFIFLPAANFINV
jgi:hypothetical protein